MANPVNHFEVIGKDGKKLQEFFATLFDWKVDANNPMNYGMVEASEGGIGGGIATGQGGDGHVTFYVGVDDVQKYLDKAEGLGGKTVQPPMDVPGGPRIALFADPEGHVIGLASGM
ncbi:MAG: VOC family protein [Dehalococcoidia bacterium]